MSCDDTADCNSITWNSRDNRCYLKNKQAVCDDISCDWGRNDAIDWNFYWKTCGKCFLSSFYDQSIVKNHANETLKIHIFLMYYVLENTTIKMQQSMAKTKAHVDKLAGNIQAWLAKYTSKTDSLQRLKGIDNMLLPYSHSSYYGCSL